MNVVHLRKKTVVPLEINGVDYVVVLDNYSIDHFQRTNKEGLLKFYDKLKKQEETGEIEITPVQKLLGSLIREKKGNKIVGEKFLSQFETMDVLKYLSPVLHQAFGNNMPDAKNSDEKK